MSSKKNMLSLVIELQPLPIILVLEKNYFLYNLFKAFHALSQF